MEQEVLANPPLVEVIFELRWELEDLGNGLMRDPQYRRMLGSMFHLATKQYPYTEELESARMPDDMVPYVVQHRFRKGQGKWPLIQIGPGIVSLNVTDNYRWSDFKTRVNSLLDTLFKAYPDPANLRVNGLLLRYIDAIDFDYEKDDIFRYLRERLEIDINLQKALFSNTSVEGLPAKLDLRFAFDSSNPKGVAHLRFERGKKADKDALIMQTMVQSTGANAPKAKGDIKKWVNRSHIIMHNWFWILIRNIVEEFE